MHGSLKELLETKVVKDDPQPVNELEALRLQWVLNCGIPVCPIKAGANHPPLQKGYLTTATTDAAQIRRWAIEFPNCNFGLVMGTGHYCLDVDVHRPEANGFDTLQAMGHGNIATFSVRTPRNGVHHYFREDSVDFPKQSPGLGLDFLGTGSYCLSPYSAVSGIGVYEPIDVDAAWQTIPDWLKGVLRAKSTPVPEGGSPNVERAAKTVESTTNARFLSRIDPSLPRNEWRNAIYASLNVWGDGEQTVNMLREWSMGSDEKWDSIRFQQVVDSHDPHHPMALGIPCIRELWTAFPRRVKRTIAVGSADGDLVKATAHEVGSVALRALIARGTVPTDQHRQALNRLAEAMVVGLFTKDQFRKAFPLPTGMGKTTLAVSLCKVIDAKKLEKSVVLFVETVDQASELKQAMIDMSVPLERIGVLHSSKERTDVPAVELGRASDYRFLIACHARARSTTKFGGTDKILTFNGTDRDLIIWDESLISTNGFHERRDEVINAATCWLQRHAELTRLGRKSVKYGAEERAFCEFLECASTALIATDEGIVQLPELSGNELAYRALARNVVEGVRSRVMNTQNAAEILEKLIAYASMGQVRIVRAGNEGIALVQFELVIDKAFGKVIILDASAPIRDLVEYDESIEIETFDVTKDYSNVVLRLADVSSSKDSFRRDADHIGRYLVELDGLLNTTIPDADELLVVCLQDVESRVVDHLRNRHPSRHGRVHVVHWGKHRASNSYAACKWMVTIGVMYLPLTLIATRIVGQTGNLGHTFMDGEIRRVQMSEQAEMLYQGISRGNSRTTKDGKAGVQTIYLFHPERDLAMVLPLLRRIMPGIRIETHLAPSLERKTKVEIRAEEWVTAIQDYLRNTGPDVKAVSVRSLVRELNADSNARSWKYAAHAAAEELLGWVRMGGHFLRVAEEMPLTSLA